MDFDRTRRATAARGLLLGGLGLLLVFPSTFWAATNSLPEFRAEAARDYLSAAARLGLAEAGTNAESCFIQARLQNNLGHPDEAERFARQALTLAPARAEIEVFLGSLLIHQDRMDEAAASLRRAVATDEKVEGGQRFLGMILERLGDPKGAEAAFTAAIGQRPGDAIARLFLGRLLLDQGRASEAVAHLEAACRLDPDSSNTRYVLYQAQTRAGDAEGARRSLDALHQLKTKEKSPMDAADDGQTDGPKMRGYAAAFHNDMANLLQRQGQTALAEAHLREAIAVAPDQPLACGRLAALCTHTGRLAEAKDLLATLVRLQPNEPSFGVNLATILLHLKDYDAAVSELERILHLDPNQPEALNNLARAYLGARRQLPEAMGLCQRLVAGQPTAANFDLLGWAFYANGRTNEALEASSQAVQLDPDNPVFRERHRRLEQVAGTHP
ncbi:MAG: tetratricopeptide repeat protein [Limisphaerales bacterium]